MPWFEAQKDGEAPTSSDETANGEAEDSSGAEEYERRRPRNTEQLEEEAKPARLPFKTQTGELIYPDRLQKAHLGSLKVLYTSDLAYSVLIISVFNCNGELRHCCL